MVYECEKCNRALPAGVLACPACGEGFDQPVPQDAEVPKRGWQPATKATVSSSAMIEPEDSSASPETTETPEEPHPDSTLPGDVGIGSQQGRIQQVKEGIKTAAESSSGKKPTRVPVLIGLGLLIAALLLIVIIRPYTSASINATVFEQHPLYQSKVAVLCHPPDSSLLGRMGTEGVWPYEGHENRIMLTFHSNGSAGIGSTPSAPLSKSDLDQEAITIRALFCGIRYRSGFTPDEAMDCQVYVNFVNSPEVGYDGPGVSPDRDAFLKARLDQVEQ
jgi:hypothetical protein